MIPLCSQRFTNDTEETGHRPTKRSDQNLQDLSLNRKLRSCFGTREEDDRGIKTL